MRPLTEAEFQIEAKPALNRIFVAEDPYNSSFASGVEMKALLYPVTTNHDKTNPELLPAIISSAKVLGDDGYFLSLINRPSAKEQDRPYHWYIPFADLSFSSEASKYLFSLEQILYSPNGIWGMMISYEDHAFFGGTKIFFEEMRRILPEFDDKKQVSYLLSDWKNYKDTYGKKFYAKTDWIIKLLTHIYGSKFAEQVLEKNPWLEVSAAE